MRLRELDIIWETLLLQRIIQWQSCSCWMLTAAKGRCLCVGALLAVLCQCGVRSRLNGRSEPFHPFAQWGSDHHLILRKLFVAQTEGGKEVWHPNMNKDEMVLLRNILFFCSIHAKLDCLACWVALLRELCCWLRPVHLLLLIGASWMRNFLQRLHFHMSALVSVWKLNRLLKWCDVIRLQKYFFIKRGF